MLTGSLASAYYGAPRSTQDIDIVIAATPAQLRTLVQFFPSEEYYADLEAALEACQRQSMFNVVDLVTGWKIDFIFRQARAFSEEEFVGALGSNCRVSLFSWPARRMWFCRSLNGRSSPHPPDRSKMWRRFSDCSGPLSIVLTWQRGSAN
jgi:hypothetical protein